MPDDDLEAIADANDPHGNEGTRDKSGRGAKRGRHQYPKPGKGWRQRLHAYHSRHRKAVKLPAPQPAQGGEQS